jgi:hypothetical protein
MIATLIDSYDLCPAVYFDAGVFDLIGIRSYKHKHNYK